MTAFLASVRSIAEAQTALAGGADIIDVKEPAAGALGAAQIGEIAAIVERVGGLRPVSATVGDLPSRPDVVCPAVERTAAAGVDIVKVGLFDRGVNESLLRALAAYTVKGLRLVAVLFADRAPNWDLVPLLAQYGLYGIMLDTADKGGGSLRQRLSAPVLMQFVATARTHGLLAGLAGSLAPDDVEPLLALAPDYLGFRGALCAAAARTRGLEASAVQHVRTLIPQACQDYKGLLKRPVSRISANPT